MEPSTKKHKKKHKHKEKDKEKVKPEVDEAALIERVKLHYGIALKVEQSDDTPKADSFPSTSWSQTRRRHSPPSHGRRKDEERHNRKHSSRDVDRGYDRDQYRDKDRDRYRDKDRDRYKDKDRDRHRDNDRHGNDYRRHERSDHKRTDEYDKRRDRNSERRPHSKKEANQDEKEDRHKQGDRPIDDTVPLWEFPWESHQYTLDKIFFREEDMIKRRSSEYDDFWSFSDKYLKFQEKKHKAGALKMEKAAPSSSDHQLSNLGLPVVYDKKHRINVEFKTVDLEKLLKEALKDQSKKRKQELTLERLEQFKQMLQHYLDFVQKQKFQKLIKIRTDQHNLPIYQYKSHIIEAIREHQVVVVAGDTGCGKSTQVPQYLLEAGFSKIACTQPRRIACISLSKRVAYETLNEYGSEVAYQVRFEKSKTQSTRILFLTEGLLLRQMGTDPLLTQYSVVVIDEVHERHIHTDFLLGVIKCLLKQREDLKLVLMSATINIELFSNYFDGAPVAKVPGRLYPIELQYVPVSDEDKAERRERLNPGPYLRILQAIDKKYPDTERGDVLIFLSGMTEIMIVVEAAKMYAQKNKKWIILPLHSALSIAEQDKVFDYSPEGVRKCIVSTNIAETSVTIDGVRFVVDSGKVKEMSYDTKYKMQKLQEFWISRASSEQRKGRAGRTGPGVCYRLYAEDDYNSLQEFSTPEIQRVPLDSLVLQMISMGLPDAHKFPFLEPPSDASIDISVAFLQEQGALTESHELTPIGEILAELPVDIIVGKMLIMASIFHVIGPVLSIAAALSVQSSFTFKNQNDYDVVHNRKSLESDHGDPVTLLNAYQKWIEIKASGEDTKKWCRRHGLEQQRFYEMNRLKEQFQQLLHEHGIIDRGVDKQEPANTAYERKARHVKVKELRKLKTEHRQQAKKRKYLKYEDDSYEIIQSDKEGSGAEDLEGNIKDIEFKLKHNMDRLHEESSEKLSKKDMVLLKMVLTSGLHPQVAIADEHNSFKTDSEQCFHTKNKGFVLIHPTSVFTSEPEVLQLEEKDIKEIPGVGKSPHGHLSNKHQMLAFVSLVETTKPYLTGNLRIPTLQSLLLFCNSLDTNADCTRIVCDGWLELRFEEPETAETTLSSVIKLRTTWQKLLQMKLKAIAPRRGVDDHRVTYKLRKLQDLLSHKLSDFMDSDIYYTIRRILAAELQHIYVGPTERDEGAEGSVKDILSDLMSSGGTPHPTKGGTQVTPYLVYNCLHEDTVASVFGEYTTCMQKHWTCPHCDTSMIVTIAERLQHEQQCHSAELGAASSDKVVEKEIENTKLAALQKSYTCQNCNKMFNFTTAEILKHKKMCTGDG